MSKPDAKLAALAEQHGLGAFRALFPYAAKNRNRLLWKLVGATAFTSLLFVGGIALFVDGELIGDRQALALVLRCLAFGDIDDHRHHARTPGPE